MTFEEGLLDGDDPWMMGIEPRRQRTDSMLESSNTALRRHLEQQILDVLRHKSELDTDVGNTPLMRQVIEPVHRVASSFVPKQIEQHASPGIPERLLASKINFNWISTPSSEPEPETGLICAVMPQAPPELGPNSWECVGACQAANNVEQCDVDNGFLQEPQGLDAENDDPKVQENAVKKHHMCSNLGKIPMTLGEGPSDEDDPWMMRLEPRRQRTDSILESSKTALRIQLEQQILDVLRHKSELDADVGSTPFLRQVTEPAHGLASSCVPKRNEQHASPGIPESLLASKINFNRNCTPSSEPEPETGFIGAVITQGPPALGPCSWECAGVCRATANKVEQCDLENNFLHGPQDLDTENHDLEDPDHAVKTAARETAADCGGLSGCTTAMMRQIPSGYTQRMLMREINCAGFLGRYDFFYVPMDARSHVNRGFAFVNFTSETAAVEFYHKFHGTQLKHMKSDKAIVVLPADIQGFEANATKHLASATSQKGKPQSKPIFFQKLPDTVRNAHSVNNDKRKAGTTTMKTDMAPIPTNGPCPGRSNCERGWESSSNAPEARVPVYEGVMLGMPQPAHKKEVLVASFCGLCGSPRCHTHMFCQYCGGKF